MKKSATLNYIIIVILGVVAIVAATYILRELMTYRQAAESYETITSKYVTVIDSDEGNDNTEQAIDENNDVSSGDDGETKDSFWYPNISIKYDELKQENSDFVGWIYIPALREYTLGETGYPIARSRDNNEYLSMTFDGTKNPSGSIFLDNVASPDFTDSNTFVFGHNMKNGTMFGCLKVFASKTELCRSNPYIYIYTEDEVLKYEIFSYHVVSRSDEVAYEDFVGEDGYDNYVEHVSRDSYYETDTIDFSKRPDLLTLSTCYGTENVDNFIVHAALVGRTDHD